MSAPVSAEVVVIGGGIAGLATAWQLAVRGVRPLLLEREPLLGTHASGRNAAIFRQVDRDLVGARLAARSLQLAGELSAASLLNPTGAIYLGAPARLASLVTLATAADVRCELLDRPALLRRIPALAGGEATAGLHFPGDGVLDVHGLLSALAGAAKARGAQLLTGVGVRSLSLRGGQLAGVVLDSGERVEAPRVVAAAGAWTAELAQGAGLVLPIEPRRRHLALLRVAPDEDRLAPVGGADEPRPAPQPVVWRVDDEVYFRPESGGYLASPCDEEPWPAGVPATSAEALCSLGEKLARVAPPLAGLSVSKAWACLRSFAPGGALVAGSEPRLPGLTWIAGLGGRGMTCGLALGEAAAAAALGHPHPLALELSAARVRHDS